MSERRKSVFGAGTSKKLGSRRPSLPLNAEPAGLTDTDTKNSKRKKNARRSSVTVLSTQQTQKESTSQKKEKPSYDMKATKKFDSMLRGDLTDLPPLPKTMVKIFLSSTFSDMRAERNILAREVYPRLQTFCASRDLDFQAVDMRWGITEDSINDHSVERLCLLEIENCQNTSVGPNFVILSGDRYGFRPVPVNIDVETFEVIQYEANKLNLSSRELLDEWYKLDKNSIPATYILQPIRSKFKFFADFSTGCDQLRERDTAEWWKTFEKLQILLRTAADEAFKENKITSERKHQFFQSVTESEIQDGILKATDVNSHCLVYKRRLRHLHGVGLNDKDTARYIDIIKSEKGNVLDEEVEKLKVLLFEDKISKKLDHANIKEYSIHWMPGGVNPDKIDEHMEYLSSFCKDFIADHKDLIQKAEEKRKKTLIKESNYYTDYNNTIHHLRFCVSRCESFCGQEPVLEAAKSYILDGSGRKPLVLYAASGVGKTSVMAMILKSIPEWLNNAPHLRLIRFLGTSPQCRNVHDVLVDVLGHLSDVYDMILPPHNYKTMKEIVQFTPRYIRQVANYAKEPIIILLDSLNQLDSRNNAYAVDWLPIFLPQNVKLIVSTLPQEHGILANLKRRLPDRECYIEIPALTEETVKEIIKTNLQVHNRSLTTNQMSFFCSMFTQTPSPLYLKLLLDEARKWKSYTPASEMELVATVKEAINKLFQTLSKKFGTLLVSHALGFVTVGLSGLTEFEIDDALSCDDEVLDEVYRFHDPPVQGIVQIPPLLWARIWYDIRGYLVERFSYGKTTLNWYHREFVLAATEMYTKGDNGVRLNKTLYEIYHQENGIKRTIELKNRNKLVITDADRQVTPQPYIAQNKRKLACLPYHTLRAYKAIGIDRAKTEVYCNFKYLYTKITAFSVSAAANDMSDFLEQCNDEEVRLVLIFLVNCKQDLTNQIRFAFCMLAFVDPEDNHYHLKSLLNTAVEFLESRKKPVLIPEFPCLTQRHNASNAFQTSIEGISDILAISESNVLLQKQVQMDMLSNEECRNIAVWNTETQELINVQMQGISKSIGQYILTDEYLYYITKEAVVKYWLSDSKSEMALFTDIVNEWKTSDCVHNIFANSDATVGAIIQDHSITLISLENFELLQEFIIPDKNLVIDAVYVPGSGQKLIVVGKGNRSHDKSERQDRETKTFVIELEQGKNLPIQIREFNTHLNCEKAVLSCKDQWLLIPTEKALLTTQSENQVTSVQPVSNGHLLAFDIDDKYFTSKEITISSTISKISVHPEKRKFIYLTSNGKVFSVLAETIDLNIHFDFTVKAFAVSWEDEIGLFCSSGRKIALYDLKSDKILIEFVAHNDKIKDICLLQQQFVTLGEDKEMKSWDYKTLLEDTYSDASGICVSERKETFLEQTNVVAISLSYDGFELITCHDDGIVKVWSVDSKKFLRQYNIEIVPDIVHTFPNSSVAFQDTKDGRMRILAINTGRVKFQLPDTIYTILHSTGDRKDNLYILSSPSMGNEQIDVVSINRELVLKTIHLQNGLSYERIDGILSANDNYLVIRLLMSKREFENARELYNANIPTSEKMSSSEQHHRYRFTAVALSEDSGELIPCNQIGTLVQPYRGNIMLISTRRWIVFWDITSGTCDRKPSKVQRSPMFCRPAWIGKECMGATRVFSHSIDQKYVACGSDDGYVFVYNSDTGLPVCNRKPLSKHNAEVHKAVISPDSKFVASSCLNSILKLWESSTGLEQFSARLDANVKDMCFTSDSGKLILYTGTYTTRVLMFSVTRGRK
ncbi:NACHT and WD repeat domain-containing protein 2-like [Mercenaria mercenaria]|uniref:NACHT and WD repeat domain-containing protein 2-like n=1 Tax=Mercenaria mercenaria TaxID=6596 RepID=UPI00234F2578|nr:NACHT and WD repeat domain-containing protein 2-like [Mercenaria mercenaria]